MAHQKFDPAKLERLNDPARFETVDPGEVALACDLHEADTIVEIGAGTGMYAARFVELAPLATVFAVDAEPAMVEWMTANLPEVKAGRLVPVHSEEETVPLPDAVADCVVMINVHHELAAPSSIYAEAARLAKPGGRVVVVDWAPVDSPKGPPAHIRVTAETIGDFLTSAGFTDIESGDAFEWHSLVSARRPE